MDETAATKGQPLPDEGRQDAAHQPLSPSRWRVLVVVVLSTMAIGGAGIAYTNWSVGEQRKAEREADRRWCRMLTTLDEAYRAAPPQSETGRRLASDISRLRTDLGCD